MEIGTYEEEFTFDEFETLEKSLDALLRFIDRLLVVLGYQVTVTLDDDGIDGIRRITATYREIDP